VFSEVSFGVSMVFVGREASPDRLPSPGRLAALRDAGRSATAAEAALFRAGWDCALNATSSALVASDCAVSVRKPGFVAVPTVNALLGYELTPRLALAATARVQWRAGAGPLAGVGLGARAEYLLSRPRPRGLRVGVFGGASVGSIQAKPAGKQHVRGAPFASSANVDQLGAALEAGTRVVYRFTDRLGASITGKSQLGLPRTLATLDAALGAEVSF